MKCEGIGALAVKRTRLSSPFPSSSLAGVRICAQCRIGLGQIVLSNTKTRLVLLKTIFENAVLLSRCVGIAGSWYV